ncbi:putative metalloprotease CJM1_0395 family protein, partial [Treponema sp. R8-4-B8]
LKKIDKKVHVHEQAHLSAAGGYARGGANYDYVTGPDGNRYANSGHVNLDTGREKTPEATIIKANIIQKAALAPADPSPSDRQIAANAAKMAADAQKEIAEEHKSKLKGSKAETQQDSPDAPQAKVKEATS